MLSLNIFASQKFSVHSAPHKIFGPPPPPLNGGRGMTKNPQLAKMFHEKVTSIRFKNTYNIIQANQQHQIDTKSICIL